MLTSPRLTHLRAMFREFIDTLVWKHNWQEDLRKIQTHWKPFLAMAAAFMLIYFMSALVRPGVLTYVFSSVACVVIGISVLARASDISIDKISPLWQFRRFSLTMIGMASLVLIFQPLTNTSDWPSWNEVVMRVGVAIMIITSPNQVPWWRYVSGEFHTHHADGSPRETAP